MIGQIYCLLIIVNIVHNKLSIIYRNECAYDYHPNIHGAYASTICSSTTWNNAHNKFYAY